MRIEAVPLGKNPPHDVNVIVEVPLGGEPIKYEMDKEAGTLVVDRFLYTAMRYPGNYGFIPHTLSQADRALQESGVRQVGEDPTPGRDRGGASVNLGRRQAGGETEERKQAEQMANRLPAGDHQENP